MFQSSEGTIIQIFHGSLGQETNNTLELEDMIQGIKLSLRNQWEPLIIEGDSRSVIHMGKRLQSGQYVVKVVSIWWMEYQVKRLADLIRGHHTWFFIHIKREGNRVADLIANTGERNYSWLVASQLPSKNGNEWQCLCIHLES